MDPLAGIDLGEGRGGLIIQSFEFRVSRYGLPGALAKRKLGTGSNLELETRNPKLKTPPRITVPSVGR
jgi:hypothetical protein